MRRFLTVLLALSLIAALCPWVSAAEDSITYVEFGSYPQSEAAVTAGLELAEYDENGDAVVDGIRYRRVTDSEGTDRYYRWDPIVWMVMGDVLLARDVIDCKMFDEQEYRETGFGGGTAYCTAVPWEECSLREFLMGDFRTLAFGESEQVLLTEDATLFTVEQAKALKEAGTDHAYLPKRATDYAKAAGVNVIASDYYAGDAIWLLRDISPILSSAVCTIGRGGGIDTGMTVLLNEEGMGLVPCIRLEQWDCLKHWTEPVPEEKVTIYYPGGLIDVVTSAEAEEMTEQGWYRTKEEAKAVSLASMEERFAASEFAEECEWYADERYTELLVRPSRLNMSPMEAADYVNRIVKTFFTGEASDYISFRLKLCYDESWGTSLDEFAQNVGYDVHETLKTGFSSWGALQTVGQYAAGSTSRVGWEFELTVSLELNANGDYSVGMSQYYETMKRLAEEARAYSDRPLGQLQYLRHYFGENTVYDANLFSNSPITLVSSGIGICGSYATFVSDFCRYLGIPCMLLSCDDPNHAWNAVYLEGAWHMIDTTGMKSKENMNDGYSDYRVDGVLYSFDPSGFPEEHTAENVDFLFDQHWMLDHDFGTEDCCSAATEDYLKLQKLFRPRASDRFTDVPRDSWFADYVDYMVENGYIQGVSADRFGPGTLSTRGMVVTILHRQAGEPEAAPATYTDVLASQWYADAVAWAAETGVVKGYSNGCFGPNDPITREQLATILWRNSGCPESDGSLSDFDDAQKIAPYAVDAIRWCVETGILSGYTDATLRPGNTATRAELAKMLTVYFEQIA